MSGHRTTITNRSLLTHSDTSPPSNDALRKVHSVTSPAMASTPGGTSMASLERSTGRSADFSPFAEFACLSKSSVAEDFY
jgi:hypothetical protein